MPWRQNAEPLYNSFIAVLVAVIPILFIFWALTIRKMKGYQASLGIMLLALLIAVAVYKMPVHLALLSAGHGALYGLFPICWIVIAAVFLFNVTVHTGHFEIIKRFMGSITGDRRLQALLIAFSFGSFLEGTAGFGAPVAITAAMLAGLGFHPLYAAGICLIANTAPVAFGAIGIPITVAAQVTGLPEMAISQMVGRTLPILSLVLPFYLVVMMAGFRRSVEVMPAILVSGLSFALLQFVSSNFLGPALPDVLAGVGSIVSMIVFLRYWKPRRTWRFPGEMQPEANHTGQFSGLQLIKAWAPFIILTVMVMAWGMEPVKTVLDDLGKISFGIPWLHGGIVSLDGQPVPHVFKLNILSTSGTAIFLSALLVLPLLGVSIRTAGKLFLATLKQLRLPVITIAAVLAFAYVVNDSGITGTLAAALAKTGMLFPFFAPVLGWLGVFITGSDTSANALFGRLQQSTAVSMGVDPVITVAANVSGGVVGKMISPQSIAIAAAAGGLVGKESDLFRFTVKHSFIMLFMVSLLVVAQAYAWPGIVPVYNSTGHTVVKLDEETSYSGYWYLAGLACILAVFCGIVGLCTSRQKKGAEERFRVAD